MSGEKCVLKVLAFSTHLAFIINNTGVDCTWCSPLECPSSETSFPVEEQPDTKVMAVRIGKIYFFIQSSFLASYYNNSRISNSIYGFNESNPIKYYHGEYVHKNDTNKS